MHLHGIRFINGKISSKTATTKLILLLMMISATVKSTYAQYIVEVWEPKPNGYHAVLQCDATGADFGGEIPASNPGLNGTGCAYFTSPEDSCEDTFNNHTGCFNYYAVVPRGNCSFSEKAFHAQRGHPEAYNALIIFNDDGHTPVPMAGSKYADRVVIPVVMVSHACMTNMMGRFSADKGYVVALRAIPGYYDLVKYLIPLVAVVAFCFIVLCISLAVRVCRERRHLARKRLSTRNLKKLPTKKYKKGDAEESCAICIDEFVEGEKLRILPCNHAYHCKCIDPWLTKVRKVCPICKRKVLSSGESDSSDSDAERRNSTATASSSTAPSYRENAPLLRNAEPLASGRPESSSRRISSRTDLPGGRRPPPPLRVVILSPTDIPPVLPRTVRLAATNAVVRESGDGAVPVPSRMQAVSNSVRRTLRPYYQHIVNRSIRVPWRNMAREPECEAEPPNRERPFAADNDAFDDGTETFRTADGPSFIAGDSSPEVVSSSSSSSVDDVPPPKNMMNKRRRRTAAGSGRLTDAHLDLQVELSDGVQQNDETTEQVCSSEPSENVATHVNHGAFSVPTNLLSAVNELTTENGVGGGGAPNDDDDDDVEALMDKSEVEDESKAEAEAEAAANSV